MKKKLFLIAVLSLLIGASSPSVSVAAGDDPPIWEKCPVSNPICPPDPGTPTTP